MEARVKIAEHNQWGYTWGMNNTTQDLLNELRESGWTWSAIAGELQVHRNAVDRWWRGERVPKTPALVNEALKRLLDRKAPKRRRYASPSNTA